MKTPAAMRKVGSCGSSKSEAEIAHGHKNVYSFMNLDYFIQFGANVCAPLLSYDSLSQVILITEAI